MEVYNNPPPPHGSPFHQQSYQYHHASASSAADELEMSDNPRVKSASMQLETAFEMRGTTPLLAPSRLPDIYNTTWTKRVRSWKKGVGLHLHGWRSGVILYSSTAATVLLVNIILTIWASAKNGISGGLATIQDGSCQETKNLSLWLHLIINVLSTLLLAASNYCMQCLSSPTRQEVDQAHSRQIWLDIGVPSVRNLRHIAWNRIILWWLLAFSGVPLHLFFNSAVFSTLSSQVYTVYAASPDHLSGNGSKRVVVNPPGANRPYHDPKIDSINISDWQILSNGDCIQAYGKDFVSSHSDVVAISSDLKASDSIRYMGKKEVTHSGDYIETVYEWMCYSSDRCDMDRLLQHNSTWKIQSKGGYGSSAIGIPIQYCVSKPVKEHCRLQMSLIIMVIVISCNVVKALCMYLRVQAKFDASPDGT